MEFLRVARIISLVLELKTPFAPRFGLNYRLTDKTMLRGGYGIFFDSLEGREIDDSADIYPYSIRLAENPTSNSSLPKFGNQMFPAYGTSDRSRCPHSRLSLSSNPRIRLFLTCSRGPVR